MESSNIVRFHLSCYISFIHCVCVFRQIAKYYWLCYYFAVHTALGKIIFRFTNLISNWLRGEWNHSFYSHCSQHCPVNDLLIWSRMKRFVVCFNLTSVSESLVSLLTFINDDYREDDLIIHVMNWWHRRFRYAQVWEITAVLMANLASSP